MQSFVKALLVSLFVAAPCLNGMNNQEGHDDVYDHVLCQKNILNNLYTVRGHGKDCFIVDVHGSEGKGRHTCGPRAQLRCHVRPFIEKNKKRGYKMILDSVSYTTTDHARNIINYTYQQFFSRKPLQASLETALLSHEQLLAHCSVVEYAPDFLENSVCTENCNTKLHEILEECRSIQEFSPMVIHFSRQGDLLFIIKEIFLDQSYEASLQELTGQQKAAVPFSVYASDEGDGTYGVVIDLVDLDQYDHDDVVTLCRYVQDLFQAGVCPFTGRTINANAVELESGSNRSIGAALGVIYTQELDDEDPIFAVVGESSKRHSLSSPTAASGHATRGFSSAHDQRPFSI